MNKVIVVSKDSLDPTDPHLSAFEGEVERFKHERLLKEAVKVLAQRCDMLGLATDNEGQLYYAGAANILDWPEFYDIDVTRFVLSLFDENPRLQEIIGKAVGFY